MWFKVHQVVFIISAFNRVSRCSRGVFSTWFISYSCTLLLIDYVRIINPLNFVVEPMCIVGRFLIAGKDLASGVGNEV